jgi:AcrR family transcriptional regulator
MPHNEKDKERTKRKLIDAVGEIFRIYGYSQLGVNKVALIAGVNKKLIYRYFGSFEFLVETYIVETDYWISFAKQIADLPKDAIPEDIQKLFSQILVDQFEYFRSNFEMQQLILWELSAPSPLMRSIHRTRELLAQQLLSSADPYLSDAKVNFRAIAALLVGGIYYLILHTRHNGGVFSDIDLSSEEGRKDIIQAIGFVVDSGFSSSGKK